MKTEQFNRHRQMIRDLLQSNLERGLNTQSDIAKALVNEFNIGCYVEIRHNRPFSDETSISLIEYSPQAWGMHYTFTDVEECERKKLEIEQYGN